MIDVLRAFSTSAWILEKGKNQIYLVSDKDLALRTKYEYPKIILVGEKGGREIKNFDFDNSPYLMSQNSLREGEQIILRMSSGTKGAIKVSKVPSVREILSGCFLNSKVLKNYLNGKKVTYLITGSRTPDGGTEDLALAHYLKGDITLREAHNLVRQGYSAKNWIQNCKDIEFSLNEEFPFIQRIYKTNQEFCLLLKKESIK